jgi:predicted amidohydrolase
MTEIRVAGAQVAVTRDVAANEATIVRAIEYARDEGADILLTPEGSLSGYTPAFDSQAVRDALTRVTARARDAVVGLALGTCYVEDDGRCYNQIRFYAPNGDYLGFHSKTLTCGSWDDPPQGEINDYAVQPLRTYRFPGVIIGGLICNDFWANPGCTPVPDPHLTQQLARMGARILFHAVNGGRSESEWSDVAWQFHSANLRMRTRTARFWTVTVDNCYPTNLRCSAPSGVISPSGNWVLRTESKGEQFFACTIELDEAQPRE